MCGHGGDSVGAGRDRTPPTYFLVWLAQAWSPHKRRDSDLLFGSPPDVDFSGLVEPKGQPWQGKEISRSLILRKKDAKKLSIRRAEAKGNKGLFVWPEESA